MSMLFVCVCVFCDSFLCSIYLLLLSSSLSYILNSVYTKNVIAHAYIHLALQMSTVIYNNYIHIYILINQWLRILWDLN